MTRVAVGSQATVSGGASLTTNSPSATNGNILVLEVSWGDAVSSGSGVTPAAPSGWSVALAALSANSTTVVRAGYSVFYKTAAGGVESPVFNDPGGGATTFYAHGIISELPSGTTFDSAATSPAIITNNTGGASTGTTVPNTGTLAAANSEVFTGLALMAGAGLANANIAFSGGSWTVDATDNDTTSSVGTLLGYKAVAGTTAFGAVYTWTSDATILCFQAATVVFSDSVAASFPVGQACL